MLCDGHPKDIVEKVAFELYEVAFYRLPRALFTDGPQYIDKDPYRDGYSLYGFAEEYIMGVYSSCGDHVVLYSLSLMLPPAINAQAAVSAA